MNKKFHDEYMKSKGNYLKYKNKPNNIMTGGYFDIKQPFDYSIINTLNNHLTTDSIHLLNELYKIITPYNQLLEKQIKPFDGQVIDLIDIMNDKIEKVKSKPITKFNRMIPNIMKNINLNEFKRVESKGNIEINNFLDKEIRKFKETNQDNNEEVFLPAGFIGSGIIEDFKNNPNKLSRYTEYESDGTKITIFNRVGRDNTELINNIHLYTKIIKKTANHLNLTFSTPNIILLLSNAKKTFELNNGVFTIDNVNSAEYAPFNNQLSIYRKEEFLKLLLHELSHRAVLERNIDDLVTKQWSKCWAVERNGSLLLRETIVETFAQFMNICILSYICNNKFKETFNILWKMELLFGLYQTAKILYMSGINSNKEFTSNQTSNKVRAMTSVVEYHIFKTILMLNFNEFYLYYTTDMGKLLDLIYDFSVNNESYNKIVDGLIEDFKNADQESTLYRTGRMSIIERNILD
ncbi:hypothetical protein QKU48_gp1365 [Fadolivirus algeromassiliense]|jgi:hypothetical protein|uniref:Uncharacterized protein n=1 Tax=Fadolivirus FV1/VV64 TaxID=3070911 RepID=A0A7D3QVD4_9VIRU|nr:hypothetical protein QKU48_gp1365 [Fadolivirus algeromassiliense]QKF94823.1 hypothetical protein Fadolivirus_1_1365 [Fadolivirus FV1/VV64]